MTRIVDCDAIRRGRRLSDPFEWATLQGALSRGTGAALWESFPQDGFTQVCSSSLTKPYQMHVRQIATPGGAAFSTGLPSIWCDFVGELLSAPYRQALSELMSLPLAGLPIEIALWQYDAGCFLAPHTDKPEKFLSHIFYMNATWDRSWGGSFLALRSPSLDDVATRVDPVLGNSVVLRRTDCSWHAVDRVRSAGAPTRRSVQVVFHCRHANPSG